MGRATVLKERIKKGYEWLLTNTDNPNYAVGLDRYEKLVDEAKKFGVKEKDCWTYEPEQQSID